MLSFLINVPTRSRYYFTYIQGQVKVGIHVENNTTINNMRINFCVLCTHNLKPTFAYPIYIHMYKYTHIYTHCYIVKYAIRALRKSQGESISFFLLWSTMVCANPKMIFNKVSEASNIPQYQCRAV